MAMLCCFSMVHDDPHIERFVDHLWVEFGLSENTVSAYRSDLKTVQAFLAARGIHLSKARDHDLLAYLSENVTQTPRTLARRLSALRRYFRYLLREGLVASDPTLRLNSPRIRPEAAAITKRTRRRGVASSAQNVDGARTSGQNHA